MLMTLEEFTRIQTELDTRLGYETTMYACNIRDLGENVFSYDFDAIVRVTVVFGADGSITEYVEGHTNTYANLEEYKAAMIKNIEEF